MTIPTGNVTARAFKPLALAFTPAARILVVDDSSSKRIALKAALEPLGHAVIEADSGIAALRRVMEDDFAVILMDVQMPGMDGFETAQLIRERWQSELTPIIFVTACSSDAIGGADHYVGGAVDFLFAPIPPSELRSKVSLFVHAFLDAQRLAVRAEEVRASVAQLEALTDSAPIGIFQTDSECRYVYTNPRWTEITGVSAELAAGRAWDSVMEPGEDGPCDPDQMPGTGFSHRFEVLGFGGARIGLITMQPMPDRDGTAAGWVGTLVDANAETRSNDALFDARDAALWASAMQRSFAASASHELRTPTASVVGYLEEVLLSTNLDEQDRKLLEVAYRNSKRLGTLIDDLMRRDQCEIGAPTINLQATALIPLAERIHATLAAAAAESGIELRRDFDVLTPSALADPARLEQALTNLVSNAIKFTPRGGHVTVAVSAESRDQVLLTVTDTGIGIEPADCSRVFERFHRSRAATDAAIPGSGLGLAIAKVMVEAQGGSITVTSRPGRGSVFSVVLPAFVDQRPSSEPQADLVPEGAP